MSNFLTREDILAMQDITWKELTVPDKIPVWGGRSLYIKQLTRGQQDEYMKRQFGNIRMKQDRKATSQELNTVAIYGHDAWICIQSICDDKGTLLFTMADEKLLYAKSGEAIGWIAKQVIEYSGMADDLKDMKDVEEAVKNSQQTQS